MSGRVGGERARAARSPSRMSTRVQVDAALERARRGCPRRPVERSSTTVTSSPRSSRASTRFDPMKPAPPVTRARMGRIRCVGRWAWTVGGCDARRRGVDRRQRRGDRLGRRDGAHAGEARVARARVAEARRGGGGEAGRVARRARAPAGSTSSRSAPAAVATTGTPGGHRLGGGERRTSRPTRDGTSASAAPRAQRRELAVADAARRSARRRRRRAPRSRRPLAGRRRRRRAAAPAARQASIAISTPFSGASREATSACGPRAGARARRRTRARRGRRRARGGVSGAPSARRRSSAKALGTTTASACATSRRCQSASAARVDDRLGPGAAAVQAHARARVAPVAARAVLAAA